MPDRESFVPDDWYKKADQDLKAAEILYQGKCLEIAGFLLQQATEKFLKGYLLYKGWKLKRTHDLIDLLNEVITYDPTFGIFRSTFEHITEYYTEERYPFLDSSQLTGEEIKTSLKVVKRLREKIIKKT
ncbi:MAG TPA: HEPN domain-containing protein [candidate division Zixibacteria bacterium]